MFFYYFLPSMLYLLNADTSLLLLLGQISVLPLDCFFFLVFYFPPPPPTAIFCAFSFSCIHCYSHILFDVRFIILLNSSILQISLGTNLFFFKHILRTCVFFPLMYICVFLLLVVRRCCPFTSYLVCAVGFISPL